MIFEKINLYISENSKKIDIKFLCDFCKKEIDKPHYYEIRLIKNPGFIFYCKDCYEKFKKG